MGCRFVPAAIFFAADFPSCRLLSDYSRAQIQQMRETADISPEAPPNIRRYQSKGHICMYGNLKNLRGFSLVELMITLAIATILISVGLPSFRDFMANSQMAATNNKLVYSLQIARSTSMERLVSTGVCASSDPMGDDASCDANASYNSGWIVYADDDGNGERNNGEEIVDRAEPPGQVFTFTATAAFESQIYFNDSGNSINVAGVPVSGTIGVEYGDAQIERTITVSANGRVSTE